jgi:DNA-binding NarL/FixJ family response regulator
VSTFRIIIVDDFEPIRRLVCSILERRAEFQIIDQASDGLEALQKIESHQPDLILLDIGLPKLNGIEVTKRVRRLAPSTRILILSQLPFSDVVEEALRSGALGYVQKSCIGSDLLPAIEAVLGGTRFVSQGLAKLPDPGRSLSHSIDFDPTSRVLRFKLIGRVTDELLRDFNHKMREAADRTRPKAAVLETSEVDSFEVTREALLKLARTSPAVPRSDFPRVVIARSPEIYGAMRMFGILAEATRPNFHVVRDEAEAWAILGVQNPLFGPLDATQ